MEFLKRLFEDTGTLITVLSSGIIGLVTGSVNGVIQRRHGGWTGFFSAIGTGTVVAVIVGLGTREYVSSEPLRYAIVGVCAVISDDIWMGLKTFGAGLRNDPLGAIARLIDAVRGKASTPPPPPPTL